MNWNKICVNEITGNRRLIAEQILMILRYRINTYDDLVKLYHMDNGWCLNLAKSISKFSKDWNLAIVEDAAYYTREIEICTRILSGGE
jgi:hypothetical protein